MRKMLLVGLLVGFGGLLSAAVDVNSLLGSAAMWLDASSPANFTFDERGGVVTWRNLGAGRATYGDAESYKSIERSVTATLNTFTNTAVRGSVESVFGAPGLEFGVVGNECDYQYRRITSIRTVFFVGRLDPNVDGTYKLAPLLGDKTSCHFHRNDANNSALWNRGWADDGDGRNIAMTFYKNSATTTCNGETTAPSYTSRDIIIVEAAANVESDCLSTDRKLWQRSAGRGVNELLIFTRVLTAEERTAVYNYLNAKWNQGGWDTGAYEKLSAYGGPDKATFAANATVGAAGDSARRVLTAQYEVAGGATATFNCPVYGGGLTFTGGGKLEFAGGGVFHGKFVQQGGTLNLGGGTFDIRASSRNDNAGGIPQLIGNITWENGIFIPDYWTEFRPQAGANITLTKGAGICKRSYWRTFIDKGVTLTLAEDAGVSDIAGPFVVTCDSKTDNYLNIHGGTLVVTNASETSASGIQEYCVTIGTQQQAGRAFMNMDGGRVITRRLRVAAGWHNEATGVTSPGTVTLGGGTVELLDCLALGNNSSTRALATVNLNGGEVISPNGVLMYNDDRDVLNFNGTVFKANVDCAKYFDFRKGSGANVTLGAGGLPFEVAEGKTVTLGWGLKGQGGIAKRGAGTLVLDRSATFTGGVDVQAGTLVAKTVDALGTGTLKLAKGATVEVLPGTTATLDVAASGTLKTTLSDSGRYRLLNVATGFAVTNLVAIALDSDGRPIADAVFSVENGALLVTIAGGFVAEFSNLADGTWFGLPWTRDGAAASYPVGAGQVTWATLVASGINRISLGADAYAGSLMVENAGESAARVMLAGDHRLHANVELTGGAVEFGVAGPTVLDGVVKGNANSVFVLDAAAGTEWKYEDATFLLDGNGWKFKKTGLGRVVYPGLPGRAVVSEAGTFAMALAHDVSSGELDFTGPGLKEKCGAGALTITGGNFGGPFAVTGGQLDINGSILNFSSLRVGDGAKVYIPHCSQVNNRLPANGQVVVDGGELHICGVNPFSTSIPEFWFTNAMMRIDCATGGEHIKFKNIHMKDSVFRLQGTAGAYNNNGIYFFSNSGKFYLDGECQFEAAEGIPNALAGEAAIPVVVAAGASVAWGTPFMSDIAKTGPGAVRFVDTVDQTKCTATFQLKEGTLLTGGRVPRLSLAAGTTVKALGGEALTITTALSLPAAGVVAVDVSEIDFESRRTPVKILTYAGFTEAMAAKFTFPALPQGWEVLSIGGLTLARLDQPRHLYWNTPSGKWGEFSWNQNPNGYAVDGYHEVTFMDNTNGVATALTTIDVGCDHAVVALDFNTTNTPYAFVGKGSIQVPSFNGGKAGMGYEIQVPFVIGVGGITFAVSPRDQLINDIRGTLGAINVPASTGGKAKLGFTNDSPRNPGAISIGAGKTLELCANFTSGSSIVPTGAVTGDSTTKLRVTAKDSTGHMDLTVNNPNFRGKVEVADGGFLYVNSQLNNVVATEQDPVWVHGTGSIFAPNGSQVNNRFPPDGWGLIEDGGQFYYRGVNPCGQSNSPSLIVSNGTIKVEMVSGSHLHLKNLRFFGNNEVFLTGTAAAYANEGLNIFGSVTVKTGTTKFYRTSGTTSKFRLVNYSDIAVESGALLQLGGVWVNAPVKTGAGTVELIDGVSLPGNAFVVNGGLIVVNALANGLTSLTLADGAGFDLSADDSCYQSASGSALNATGRISLRTGERELRKGEYLVKWTAGNAPSCEFRLESTAAARSSYSIKVVDDGVKVEARLIAILVR